MHIHTYAHFFLHLLNMTNSLSRKANGLEYTKIEFTIKHNSIKKSHRYDNVPQFYFYVHRCGCDECVTAQESDSLRYSQSRINAFRALSASSLIALSSRDPVLTAFELSWELKRLQAMESEFRAEYGVRKHETYVLY